jgi:beta-mannosidase
MSAQPIYPMSQQPIHPMSEQTIQVVKPTGGLSILRSAITLTTVCLLACATRGIEAQVQHMDLNQGWEFRRLAGPSGDVTQDLSKWRPAVVPGDVHLDLLREKLIPDPFYRTNESKLQWISDDDWQYRTHIDVPATTLQQEHVELVFDGLDTYAHVLVNGHEVLTSNNMFRTWRVDAKPWLHAGSNELIVTFPAPERVAREIAEKDPWYTRTHVDAKTYVRKAAYEYGWDWGPKFVTSGVWRPVRLESWSHARIADLAIHQTDVSAGVAHLNAEVQVLATAASTASLALTYSGPDGIKHSSIVPVTLHAGENVVDIPVAIDHPALWFPAGYGTQSRYNFTATLTAAGRKLDTRETRTGLRSVVLRRDPDKWGRSFEFVVNGIPIYAKGADVIPFDSFPNRVTTAEYRHILQSAHDSNMNMVRAWGGGYYETDTFYDLCDELGLMVWQEFMFGNEWQPGTYDFKLNVAHEAEDQLRRLRNHPSIVIWCGNNETEMLFNSQGRDKLDGAVRLQMWQDYLSVFHGVLASAVSRYAPETPYWPSSPSADLEALSDTYRSGDEHLWDVWHGRAPFSQYETHHPRFVTEFGFQSFPELRTVDSFTLPEDRTSIFTPVMLAHQKNTEGNALINMYLLRDYAAPKDFASFLYMSQVLQAEGIKLGSEHFRRERPETMGSIFWQLNDCWPVASWSSIDSLGRWKALQFYAKRFYAPILVSPHVEDGALQVHVVSDRTVPRHGTLEIAVRRMDGTTVQEKSMELTVAPLSSTLVYQEPLTAIASLAKMDSLAQLYVSATLQVEGEETSRNLSYLTPTRQVQLPAAKISLEVAAAGDGADVTVHSSALARSVYLDAGSSNIQFSDNYFDLQANESRTVHVSGSSDVQALRTKLKVVSVADALSPAAP